MDNLSGGACFWNLEIEGFYCKRLGFAGFDGRLVYGGAEFVIGSLKVFYEVF